jgi:spore coat protein H
MRSFAEAVAKTTPEDFDDDIAPHVDVEALLRYIAVDRALRNWDGITAFYSPLTPHNFFWYHDDGDADRFHLIPWDLDNTLWDFDPYMYPEQWVTAPPLPDLSSTPWSCQPRPVWDLASGTFVTPPRCDKLLDLLIRNHWSDLVSVGTSLRGSALDPERMQAIADHYRAQIEPIVAEDPTLDVTLWDAAVDHFSDVLIDATSDFDAFLEAGLIEEAAPVEPDPPTQEELDAPSLDEGLHVGGITNFEFAEPPVDAMPAGVLVFADPLAIFTPAWSTVAPISGAADLRLDFSFTRGPEPYDEWVNLALFSGEADVSTYKAIVVWLASDVPRQVRIRVASPAYDEAFGGIWQEFGVDRSVSPTPQAVVIDFASLYYPAWAREPWAQGQGFTGTDAEAKALVLSRFNGLIFVPAATLDAAGELTQPTETGHLRVDNIYFR